MGLTLANRTLVVSGTFAGLDTEDVRWDLISRGAFVKRSVTRTTAALIAGDAPEKRHLAGARKHGTPILDRAALVALLDGATLEAVLSGSAVEPQADLDGWRVAIVGTFPGQTRATHTSALEARGARVTKPSASCDLLVLGDSPGLAAVEAQDAGVPFVDGAELTALLSGTPITELVAPPGPATPDRRQAIEAGVASLLDALTSLEAGERVDDVLTLSVQPSGRGILELRELGGTPLHDTARKIVQRTSWPVGDDTVVITRPLTWS